MSSIAAELLEADKTLGQETNRYWREISNESYVFDRGMRRRGGGERGRRRGRRREKREGEGEREGEGKLAGCITNHHTAQREVDELQKLTQQDLLDFYDKRITQINFFFSFYVFIYVYILFYLI